MPTTAGRIILRAALLLLLVALVSKTPVISAAKDIPLYHVQAVAGDAVYLPCDISTVDQGDAVLLVLWYREDLGTPIYSVDAREREFSQAERWSDERVFSNRAYFMPDKQPAELGIDHIQEGDAGVYRCRVDFKVAQTRNSKVNLTVIVPPQKLMILDETGVERTSVVGPYAEGATLQLRCIVYGGKPRPVVTWYRNDELQSVQEEAAAAGRDQVRRELVVRSLGRQDLHSQLKCVAQNNNRTQPLEATVHVDMNFPPLDVRILGVDQPLSQGRRYDLMCQSSGSRPPASITWWRDGQRLEGSKETTSSDGNTTTSTLSFRPSKEDEGRYLACRAENTVISSEGLEDGRKLEIQYVPEVQIHLGTSLNPNTIREGTDVYFDCTVNAHPPIYKVEWRHNKKTLNHNISQRVLISNQSLVLQGVSRASAGNYTCVGFNTEGDGESAPFHLNVMYAPTCKPNQTRVHGVAKQEKVNISCEVEANPSQVTFRWMFNNSAEALDVQSANILLQGTSSVVFYTPMTDLDYGTLLCWAANRIGNQRKPCVFHIIPAGRPDLVHNCSIANSSMTSFSIRCQEGYNGGLPQSFLLEVRDSSSHEVRVNMTGSYPRFAVTGLEPSSQYLVYVYSFNMKGRSEPVVTQASTLRLPEKQLTAEKERPKSGVWLTPMMSVLIGIFSALIVVAVVIVVVLRLQCSRNEDRRKRHKAAAAEQRCGGSSASSGDKGGSSPINKLDPGGNESGDSDEKNPDIIPQPCSDCDEHTDFLRKRQHISTIETSPTRSLLQQGIQGHGYPSYCTVRNGMPLQELNSIGAKHKMGVVPGPEGVYPAGAACTLPRQHWPSYGGGVPHLHRPAGGAPVASGMCVSFQASAAAAAAEVASAHKQPLIAPAPAPPEEEAGADTPLMMSKRESSV